MKAKVAALLVCSAALGALATVTLGIAPDARADNRSAADDKYDPANHTHISKFMETCVQGNAKFVSRDFPGAIDSYRKAIQLQPTNPLGHYLLGEAQSASGNLTEAEASWTNADNLGDKDPPTKTKLLFVLADLKERQKKWDDAKAGWQRYAQYVAAHPDAGGSAATSDARIKAIDDMLKQDKAYDIVRERIAAEKADAGK
ncbi:MAG TPA: tetratricopeptide repeat protein [Polyangiaceae bacterium]|nr:tetratricopeptide repeat protein [Polyangiaceae bacterium]